MSKAITRGAHHIGLTVPDIDATRRFFTDILGYEQVGEVPDYPAVFLQDGVTLITLWQAADPANATPFDRRNVIGLHHLALNVASHVILDRLHASLRDADGVEIEFPPEALGRSGIRHMMTRIPGGIRVEFLSPGP